MLNDRCYFRIRLSASLVAAVDEWRGHQPDLPPRAEAVVRLVEIGLEAHAEAETMMVKMLGGEPSEALKKRTTRRTKK
jgi:hypothetical protein